MDSLDHLPLLNGPDPWPERTPCLFEGCRLSVEEHHRLTRGMSAEIRDLKERLKPDRVGLNEITDAALVAEVARRMAGNDPSRQSS